MGTKKEITVPDLGDFDEVEVIEVLVSVGQILELEESMISLETDKAAMDVPSPMAGVVTRIDVNVGDRVSHGSVILEIETSSDEEEVTVLQADTPEEASDGTVMIPAVSTSDAETVMMPHIVEIQLPNLGDFDAVEIIEVMISDGDQIEVDTPLLTLETDKATMDVPSTEAGIVKQVKVSVGDRISEGDVIALCEVTTKPESTTSASVSAPVSVAEEIRTSASPTHNVTQIAAGAAPAVLPPISESTFKLAHASPAVRKFARELGVNLSSVRGTGLKNRVSKDDVKSFVKSVMLGGQVPSATATLPKVPQVDFAKYGEIDEQPLTRIQKLSGPRLHASWVNLPHVTHNDLGDFTLTEASRKQLKTELREQGIRLTALAYVMRACVIALEQMPLFNASLSEDGKSLVYKKYINLGFAADTPNGLVVPVIHNAQDLSVIELARQLGELSQLARDGKLKATQMQGGTFTVSSLGGIGGTSFTPIINAPEVAILGVSRSQIQPVYIDGEFQPRLMLPLSLSYDHRVIDGANAARFTALLAQLVSDPEGLNS